VRAIYNPPYTPLGTGETGATGIARVSRVALITGTGETGETGADTENVILERRIAMNYMKKLIEEIKAGRLEVPEGSANVLEVAHDKDCPLLQGLGPCDCDPDITLRPIQ